MSEFEVVRTIHVAAPPATVHALVDDFHEWPRWSPWEGLDPAMERTHSGPEAGPGAMYAWSGNRKAGAGSMEITDATPEHIDIALTFLKPFAATNRLRFTFAETAAGTDVSWRMSGEQKGLWSLIGKVWPMDRMVGKDFEKGLVKLRGVAQEQAV